MSQNVVYASEDEGETFGQSDISQERLLSGLRRRRRVDDQVRLKETNALSQYLKCLIDEYIEILGEDTVPIQQDLQISDEHSNEPYDEALNEQRIDPVVNDNQPSTDHSITSRWTARRKRNVSFYQQHIYTIDSVSYILRISLEQATALVKNKPELIEYYHDGSLKSFLSTGKRKTAKNRSCDRRSLEQGNPLQRAQPPDDSQSFESKISVECDSQELYTDASDADNSGPEGSSSESSDQESEEMETDEEVQEIMVKGRTYKDVDALSRGSKLPKSFFALMNTGKKLAPRSSSKRLNVAEDRVGLAKKKMRTSNAASASSNDLTEGLFTVDDNSQQINDRDTAHIRNEVSSPFKPHEVAANYNPRKARRDDDDILMFKSGEFQNSTFHKVYQPPTERENDWYTEEARGSGVDQMLASKRPRSSKHSSKSEENKPIKFKRNPSGSVKPSNRQRKSPVSGPKPSYTKTLSNKLIKNIKEKNHLYQQQAQRNIYDFTVDGEFSNNQNDSRQKPSKTSSKDQNQKKKAKNLFFLTPSSNAELPRAASTSTVVYEGLSNRFAVVNKKIAPSRFQVVNEEVFPEVANVEDDVSSKFRSHFANSDAYKKLFTTEKVVMKREYRVVLGSNVILLSSINSGFQDSLKKVFDLLLTPSVLRNMSNEGLIDSLIEIIGFCSYLESSQIKSLVIMIDSFKFQVDADIKRKGQIKDVQFYYLSFCYMLYYCCYKVYENNYLNLFNFREKAEELVTLFFEYVSYIDSSVLRNKLNGGHLLFYESLLMLFLTEKDLTWSAVEKSAINDTEFLKQLCFLLQLEYPLWKKLKMITLIHLKNEDWGLIKNDFKIIDEFSEQLGWVPDEGILVVMYECLKRHRFQNFSGEYNHPVIFSPNDKIHKDSLLNIYLNSLMKYSNSTKKPSLRLLEKIIPLSKLENMNVNLFCNRVNLILTLSVAFKQNLDGRIFEIISSCEFTSKIMLQRGLRAIQVLILINNSNKTPTKLGCLQELIDTILSTGETESWINFISNIKFESLNPKTQRSLLTVMSNFKQNKEIIIPSTFMIKHFISSAPDKSALLFIKEKFGDLNSTMFPELWCFISGELVSKNMENWSRLMHFNNFEDETLIFTYILRHSGSKIYQLEKDIFINSLLKNIVKRNIKPSLNSYIRQLEKNDPKLFNVKNLWVQSHKLQITISIVSNLLKGDSLNSTARYLALVVNFLKLENDLAAKEYDNSYCEYARKVIEFINKYGFQFVNTSNAFAQLCNELKIPQNTSSLEESQLINMNGTIQESLKLIETKLIGNISSGLKFSKAFVPILLKHNSKKFGDSEQLSDSKLYSICCTLSAHIEILKFLPSCWIILNEITICLLETLKVDRNLSRIDIYCLLKTIALFQFILRDRNSRYLEYELLTLKNIYEIFYKVYFLLSGSNELSLLIDMIFPFLSRNILFENYVSSQVPKYLVKVPNFIKDMVINANLTSDGNKYSSKELKSSLEREFNRFILLIDDFYEDNDFELYTE